MTSQQNKTYLGFKLLYKHEDNPYLYSPLYPQVWEFGEIVHAACDVGRGRYRYVKSFGVEVVNERHEAPELECTCGFHVAWDIHGAAEFLRSQKYRWQTDYFTDIVKPILALVEGGGNVVQHETGFRSEWATVKGLVALFFPGHAEFREMVLGGRELEVLRQIDFESPWEIYNPGEAIMLVEENKQYKKE